MYVFYLSMPLLWFDMKDVGVSNDLNLSILRGSYFWIKIVFRDVLLICEKRV